MKTTRKIISLLISVTVFICIGLGLQFTAFADGEYDNSYSLTLGDNIVTNYTIDAAGYKADGGTTLEYTYNNAEGEEYTETTETVDLSSVNSSTYAFSIPQAAAQIAEPVTVTVKNSGGTVIDTFDCSAKSYCDYYINMSDYDINNTPKGKRLQNICKSVVAYAYAAQQEFSSYMALEGTVPITNSYATDLDINSADYTDTTGRVNVKGTKVKFKSFSFFCTSTARIRFYLDTTNATESDLSTNPSASNLPSGVKVNKGYDEDKGKYFIDVNGLKPVDFDKIITVSFCDASISMSALHYAGAIIASSGASATTKYLAKTLIVYYDKATKYFDNNVTVTFNANGGTSATSETTVTSGSSLTLPNATKTGNTFNGWYTASSGGTRVGGNGDSYTPNDNITLYAQWSAYTVTYNANGGTVSPASDTVDASGNVTLPTPTWAGHRFDGWYTAASGGTSVGAAGATYAPSSSTTVYAHWTAYTVTFNANGGTVSPSSATAGNDGTVTLPTPSARTGYDFDGWYTAATGGSSVGEAGDSYTPTSSSTVYAHWTAHTHTVSWNNTASSTKVYIGNNTSELTTGTSVAYDTVIRVVLSYNESNDRSFTVQANNEDVPRYTDFACTSSTTSQDEGTYFFKMPDYDVTITSYSKASCIVADTLITLADGSTKRADELTGDEELLVWNLETGTYDSAPILFLDDSDEYGTYHVVHLTFSDGTETKLISEHAYFNLDLGEYVYIRESNYSDYIGDRFVKQDDIQNNTWKEVTLVDSEVVIEETRPFGPCTADHLCFYVDGLLSIPGASTGFFNIFDVDTETMTYDFEAMQRDIETYGLYTYEEFEDLVPEEVFYAANCAYLKISVGKGLMTWDDVVRTATTYAPFIQGYYD